MQLAHTVTRSSTEAVANGMLMFLFFGLGYGVASITFTYALAALGRLIVPQASSLDAVEDLGELLEDGASGSVIFQDAWLVSVIPKPG
jgi:hypothetical protein